MAYSCEECGAEVLEIDVKCSSCGASQTSTGAHRMLGNVFLGQYEIVDVLGQGGMSVVYKARHRLTEQEVALKLLPPELAMLTQVKSRFVEEAKALAQLDHPNIVHLYNFGEENGCFVLAMQFVPGQTWERMILDAEAQDWTLACRIAIDVLRALEYAHGRGIIHRDMKPSNVLVREDDGTATVMDFGIAKMTNSTKLTATGQTMGTVRYMSPEQVRGLSVDVTTDIYSLGATLFEAIYGDTPFDGDTHFEIMTKHLNEAPVSLLDLGVALPVALDAAIMKSLGKKPEERFSTARQFRKEIEGILKEHDIGWAETMRLTRSAVAIGSSSRPHSARVNTGEPATQSSGAKSRPLAAPEGGPVATDATTAALGTVESATPADSLELAGTESPSDGRAGTATIAPSSSRSFLWIALVGVLLLAAGGTTLYLTRSQDSGDKSAGHIDKPVTPTSPIDIPNTLLAPFRPQDTIFDEEKTFRDEKFRVMAPGGWDVAEVADTIRTARKVFNDLLKRHKLADEVPVQAISVAIVNAQVFCDRRVYEAGRNVPADCAETEIHYRPKERTLFIRDDKASFGANLAYGNGAAVCLHLPDEIPGCGTALAKIDEEFAKRKKPKKKKTRSQK